MEDGQQERSRQVAMVPLLWTGWSSASRLTKAQSQFGRAFKSLHSTERLKAKAPLVLCLFLISILPTKQSHTVTANPAQGKPWRGPATVSLYSLEAWSSLRCWPKVHTTLHWLLSWLKNTIFTCSAASGSFKKKGKIDYITQTCSSSKEIILLSCTKFILSISQKFSSSIRQNSTFFQIKKSNLIIHLASSKMILDYINGCQDENVWFFTFSCRDVV